MFESFLGAAAGALSWLYANALAPAASVFLSFLAPRAPLVALTAAGAGFAWWRLRPSLDDVQIRFSVYFFLGFCAILFALGTRLMVDEAGRPVEGDAELVAAAIFIASAAWLLRNLWRGRLSHDRLSGGLWWFAAAWTFFLLLSLSIRWVYTLP